jgi:hypothetical protein
MHCSEWGEERDEGRPLPPLVADGADTRLGPSEGDPFDTTPGDRALRLRDVVAAASTTIQQSTSSGIDLTELMRTADP